MQRPAAGSRAAEDAAGQPAEADGPRISVFTAAHDADEGILVPARSVLAQSEEAWEWVIVEDSRSEASATRIRELEGSPEARGRIRLQTRSGDGSIGAAKRAAASLCTTGVLVELDHDDELRPDALALVLAAFDTHPELDFLCSDWVDLLVGEGEEPEACTLYPDGWGFGLGAYASEVLEGHRVPVALSPALNWETVRHIVSMPNHLRAWRTAFYRSIGGHDPALPVGDDYELLARTFIAGRMGRLPHPLYVQRHERSGGSASRARNREIQARVAETAERLRDELDDRCLELGAIPSPVDPLTGPEPIADASLEIQLGTGRKGQGDAPFVSVVVPTYRRPEELGRALGSVLEQTHEDFEVLVVGDACPDVDEVVAGVHDFRVRHWNLPRRHDDGGAAPRNYAVKAMARSGLIAYLDDDNRWAPEHLQSLVELLADPGVAYAFSSISIGGEEVICEQPRLYLIDTSSLLHRRSLLDRYGYWRSPAGAGMPAHDWELVSRWRRERWAASRRPTLSYTLDPARHRPELLEAIREAAASQTRTPGGPEDVAR